MGNRLIFQPYFPFSKNESILSSLAISGEEYYSVLCRDSDISPFSDIASVIEKSKKMSQFINVQLETEN